MDLWWPQCETIQQGNSRHLSRMPLSSVFFYSCLFISFSFPFLFFFILFFFTFRYLFLFLYSFEGLLTKDTNSLFSIFFSQKHNQQAPP